MDLPPSWHAQTEWEVACAYELGVARGRQQFAAELLPALRWLLAGIGPLDPDAEAQALLLGDFDRLMGRHLRLVDQAAARHQADAGARAAA